MKAPMKTPFSLALVTGLLLTASTAQAVTFDLDLVADGDSRWFDLFSAAYAQVDQGFGGNPAEDGFFDLSADTNGILGGAVGDESVFDSFAPVNFGTFPNTTGVDIFPQEENFSGVGSLDFNAGTGQVTSLQLEFSPFVVASTPLGDVPYATSVSNINGMVTTQAGNPASISLTADIEFSLQTAAGAILYNGDFSIDGKQFDLFVDDQKSIPVSPAAAFDVRLAWDIEGSVGNLVPEPTSAAMSLLGLLLFSQVSHRRS